MSVTVAIVAGPLPAVPSPWHPSGAGAVLTFEGVVRPTEEGRPIDGLDYDAYRPMAEKLLGELGDRVLQRHGLIAVAVEHSVGAIGNGEVAFRLRVASAHRAEGLAAAEEFIDLMKQDVPIFKLPRWSGVPSEGGKS